MLPALGAAVGGGACEGAVAWLMKPLCERVVQAWLMRDAAPT